ncbi:MAG TPA: universal stress protein [Thermomicrobiales bacterium]|nr:universal stress protein [Thermomicrobiales bacterium]
MIATIFVPLDGSAGSAQAAPYAARLARSTGARLVLCLAAPPAARDDEERAAHLTGLAARVAASGVAVETAVAAGATPDALLAAARRRRADLVVLAADGPDGAWPSRAARIADLFLQCAGVPVLLVPASRAAPALGEDCLLEVRSTRYEVRMTSDER